MWEPAVSVNVQVFGPFVTIVANLAPAAMGGEFSSEQSEEVIWCETVSLLTKSISPPLGMVNPTGLALVAVRLITAGATLPPPPPPQATSARGTNKKMAA